MSLMGHKDCDNTKRTLEALFEFVREPSSQMKRCQDTFSKERLKQSGSTAAALDKAKKKGPVRRTTRR